MRPFVNVEEAERGVGRVEVCAGIDRGILKAIETTDPVAVVALHKGSEIYPRRDLRIPLRNIFLLEPGD